MSSPEQHVFALTDYLVGPFLANAVEKPDVDSLSDWQIPYHSAALNALQKVTGSATIDETWLPSPEEGANLYRDLSGERKLHRMTLGLEQYIAAYKSGETTTRLWPHQQEALDSIEARLKETRASKQITIKSATGTGKTAIFINLIQALKSNEAPSDPVRTLILVPTKDLVLQTKDSFANFAESVELGVYYSDEKSIRDVTLMTYYSFNKTVEDGTLKPEMFDVIIKDEEHESWGDSTARSMKKFAGHTDEGKRKLVIGFSATPKEKQNIAHERTLMESVGAGILAPISSKVRKTESRIPEIASAKKLIRDEYTEEELAALIDDDPRNTIIIEEVVSGLKSGRRVGVRCLPGGKLLHPYLLNERLRRITTTIVDPYTSASSSRYIRSAVIDGAMPPATRKAILNAFNTRELDGSNGVDVILFVDTLVRGWDSPIAKKIINGCPSLSPTVMEQLLGRITRPFQRLNGSHLYGQAVDLVDESRRDQVLFADIINKYAPEGMRYIAEAVIGAGLKDPRKTGNNIDCFEIIPDAELDEFKARQDRANGIASKTSPAKKEKSENSAKTPSNAVHLESTPTSPLPTVPEKPTHSPFEFAQEAPGEIHGSLIGVTESAESHGISPEEFESIITSENIVVYKNPGSDGYSISTVSHRRLKALLN